MGLDGVQQAIALGFGLGVRVYNLIILRDAAYIRAQRDGAGTAPIRLVQRRSEEDTSSILHDNANELYMLNNHLASTLSFILMLLISLPISMDNIPKSVAQQAHNRPDKRQRCFPPSSIVHSV